MPPYPNVSKEPLISILMATYNGAAFLEEQLQSFRAQTYQAWELIVSDDGSTDDTRDIIHRFAKTVPNRVVFREGPRKGYAANFMSLVLGPESRGEYFAFSDQDDVWLPDKIEAAMAQISRLPAEVPALYGARTIIVGAGLERLTVSPPLRREATFSNALAQNVAGGNTMVFNSALVDVLRKGGHTQITSQDWWLYLVVTAVGGHFIFDPTPRLLYRQHGANLVGTNSGLQNKLIRIRKVLEGRYYEWLNINLSALKDIEGITGANARALSHFSRARQAAFPLNVLHLLRSGVRRQTFLGNVALFAACALKRI